MNKIYYTDAHIKAWVHEIIRKCTMDNWKPEYVVGLTRGGLTPALMISQYFDIPMETLKVSLRDSAIGPESNLWMAEDAFGYNGKIGQPVAKDILIVDDINDSGATLNWIKKDWQSSCLPDDKRWSYVWGHNVRIAVLVNNEASEFKDVDYTGISINKIENPVWCVFPWEQWWAN